MQLFVEAPVAVVPIFPAGHLVQNVSALAPTAALYVPAPHGLQTASLSAFVSALHLPTAHAVHVPWPPPEYRPDTHGLHTSV